MSSSSPGYAVEPIVSLCGSDDSPRWGELLYRGSAFPQTIEDWRDWHKALPSIVPEVLAAGDFDQISVNVDSEHLLDAKILEDLYRLEGLPVLLEWTEHRVKNLNIRDIMRVGKRLEALRSQLNAPVVLDDLGAGEDSFRRLCALQPDLVKIDGEIFQLTRRYPRIIKLLCAKIKAYEDAGIPVVVEWIETIADLSVARKLGATWGQGYLWTHASASQNHASALPDLMDPDLMDTPAPQWACAPLC